MGGGRAVAGAVRVVRRGDRRAPRAGPLPAGGAGPHAGLGRTEPRRPRRPVLLAARQQSRPRRLCPEGGGALPRKDRGVRDLERAVVARLLGGDAGEVRGTGEGGGASGARGRPRGATGGRLVLGPAPRVH